MTGAPTIPPPLVSIVLTTYNGERFVRETLKSLVSQTYPNLEIVVSDDGSTDGTITILKEFAARYPAVRLNLNEKNIGIARNYNLAVRMARGEFVIGISHDDLLPPTHVEKMVPLFSTPKIGLVHCNAVRIDENGRPGRRVASDREKIEKSRDPMRSLCFNNFVQSCGMMFRRQAFLDIGGWDEAFSYDSEWYTYVRYAENYDFLYTTQTHAFYRVHDANISGFLKKKRRTEFEAYRQRCREMAMARARLTRLDRFLISFKVWRKELRGRIRNLLAAHV